MFPSASGLAVSSMLLTRAKRLLRLGLRPGILAWHRSCDHLRDNHEESEPLDLRKTPAEGDSAPDRLVPSQGPAEPVLRPEMLAAMVEGAREGLCIMDPRSVLLHSNQVAGQL